MTPAEWIGAWGVSQVPLLGGLKWFWSVSRKADEARQLAERALARVADIEADMINVTARLKEAEQTTGAVRELSDAIKHQGQMMEQKILHLTEMTAEHNSYVKKELGEVRHEQKNVRQALSASGR